MSKESYSTSMTKSHPSSPPPVLDEKRSLSDLGRNSLSSTPTTVEHRSPPPAYQPIFNYHHSLSSRSKQYVQPTNSVYYQPTPSPQTVIVHDTPSRSKDSCCWGCVAGLILCLGAKECLCC